jgi:hypothetical protein
MNKATAVYLGMFIVLIGGLAVIMQVGSSLSAPPDIRGRWTIIYDAAPSTMPTQLFIEQSGLYLRGALAEKRLRGRMISNGTSSSALEATDHTLHLDFVRADRGDELRGYVRTTDKYLFRAVREPHSAPVTDAR